MNDYMRNKTAGGKRMPPSHYTLFELNRLVRQSIELSMRGEFWVEAELSEARENNGHCYMSLVQKDEAGNTPLAKASAKCWRSSWLPLRQKFEKIAGMRVCPGMKVLLKVYPQFHEAFGFSWIVVDIDPTYTLGDMARRRMEIIKRLEEEGVLELNKQLPLPMFMQRIAVVSSPTAAGYGDFRDQLQANPNGYKFSITLFPATMQGEDVEQSIVGALNEIYQREAGFDCVVIIRGGGASSDLSGFDSLALAENVANFPLPVIAGIGHERDETVVDIVAHTSVKTPTAAAALLIDNLRSVDQLLSDMRQRIYNNVRLTMQAERQRLAHLSQVIPTLFSLVSTRQLSRIDALSQCLLSAAQQQVAESKGKTELMAERIPAAVGRRLSDERHRLALLSQSIKALDPQLILDRGYSITLLNGKAVRSSSELATGDKLRTRFAEGEIKSVVE